MLGPGPFSEKNLTTGHLHCPAQIFGQTLHPASKGMGRSLARAARAPELRLGCWSSHCSQCPQGVTRSS